MMTGFHELVYPELEKKAVDGIYHNKHYLWSSGNLFNLSCGTFPGSDYSFMPREGMGGIYCGVCGIEYNK